MAEIRSRLEKLENSDAISVASTSAGSSGGILASSNPYSKPDYVPTSKRKVLVLGGFQHEMTKTDLEGVGRTLLKDGTGIVDNLRPW